jgi:hypothetical protein
MGGGEDEIAEALHLHGSKGADRPETGLRATNAEWWPGRAAGHKGGACQNVRGSTHSWKAASSSSSERCTFL